jgi:hypothetical protein
MEGSMRYWGSKSWMLIIKKKTYMGFIKASKDELTMLIKKNKLLDEWEVADQC